MSELTSIKSQITAPKEEQRSISSIPEVQSEDVMVDPLAQEAQLDATVSAHVEEQKPTIDSVSDVEEDIAQDIPKEHIFDAFSASFTEENTQEPTPVLDIGGEESMVIFADADDVIEEVDEDAKGVFDDIQDEDVWGYMDADTPVISADMQIDHSWLSLEFFEDTALEETPPLLRSTKIISLLLNKNIAERAMLQGDDLAVKTLRQQLSDLVSQDLTTKQEKMFFLLARSLEQGIIRLKQGQTESNLELKDLRKIKSVVDSGLIATQAKHAERLDGDADTLLAFQNISAQESEEVQDGLQDSDKISKEDRKRLLADDVSSIEIEEVMVDWWEMSQHKEYEVVEEDDLK